MFAATQQIASIAGLKATKVQVRTLSSSSSQYSFSGKDLVAFGARARVSLPLSLSSSLARDMSFLRALRARGSSFPSLSISPSRSGN